MFWVLKRFKPANRLFIFYCPQVYMYVCIRKYQIATEHSRIQSMRLCMRHRDTFLPKYARARLLIRSDILKISVSQLKRFIV